MKDTISEKKIELCKAISDVKDYRERMRELLQCFGKSHLGSLSYVKSISFGDRHETIHTGIRFSDTCIDPTRKSELGYLEVEKLKKNLLAVLQADMGSAINEADVRISELFENMKRLG